MTATPVRRLADKVARLPADTLPKGSRGTILDVALRLFAEHGFAGTSIRDIAATANLQSATLYGQYPSKSHILEKIIHIGHTEHHRQLHEALETTSSDAPKAQLIALVRAHVHMHAQYPMLAVVTHNELHCLPPELIAKSNALRHQSEMMILQVIQHGSERDLFDVDNPLLAATAIGGMGLRVAHWFTPEQSLSVDDVATSYAEYACRIVGACCPHEA